MAERDKKKANDIMSNTGKVEREWLFPVCRNMTTGATKIKLSGVCSKQIKGALLHTECNQVSELIGRHVMAPCRAV